MQTSPNKTLNIKEKSALAEQVAELISAKADLPDQATVLRMAAQLLFGSRARGIFVE